MGCILGKSNDVPDASVDTQVKDNKCCNDACDDTYCFCCVTVKLDKSDLKKRVNSVV